MKNFSRKTAQKLKNYVYTLVDPQTEEIFYVGKGSGPNRPFTHLDSNNLPGESEKNLKVEELRANSIEPRVDILRYGLDRLTALEVEAAVIDAIGLHKLTNKNSGDKSSERGRFSASQIEARLGGSPLEISEIKESAILFYRKDACPAARLYDETRQFWSLSQKKIEEKNHANKLKYQYAFAMRGNFVLEIYEILAWYAAGTTVSSRAYERNDNKQRWEFIGSLAPVAIRKKYCSRSLITNGEPLHATQIGFRYLG